MRCHSGVASAPPNEMSATASWMFAGRSPTNSAASA
ncbi:hypothetical protein [Kribbella sp. NPDC048928]